MRLILILLCVNWVTAFRALIIPVMVLTAFSACGQDEGNPAGANRVDTGSDGEDGEDGADGAQGPQGETGPQGPAGADGEDVLPPTLWIDPITENTWSIGATAVWATASTACLVGGEWRQPTESEALQAAYHGIGLVNAESPTTMWTSTSTVANEHQRISTIQSAPASASAANALAGGVYCIKDI
jgi:hypothetical protein